MKPALTLLTTLLLAPLAPLAALDAAEELPAGVSTYTEIYRTAVERRWLEKDTRRRESSEDINLAYAAWMLGEAIAIQRPDQAPNAEHFRAKTAQTP